MKIKLAYTVTYRIRNVHWIERKKGVTAYCFMKLIFKTVVAPRDTARSMTYTNKDLKNESESS